MNEKRVTVPMVRGMKKKGEKIVMLTAYDFTFAALMDQAEIDILLVGDSLGMVVQGHDSTLPVTVEDIIYHTRAVKRAAKRAMVVADMPFLSYQITPEEAVLNAGRLLKEGGADAVKVEGGRTTAPAIRCMTDAGIPVMGHVGLGPQSCKMLGGHKVQGKTASSVRALLQDALAVEQAGAFSMVIEAVPWPVARRITERASIPTIGIGAGPYCDGQVLVFADMLGLFTAFQPHFVRRFARMGDEAVQAFHAYRESVRNGSFPTLDESYSVDDSVLQVLDELTKQSPDTHWS
ncbi:MAG TPA: 3-methyl-2-oxobutanoate hydroxymethyltransferase [bacterium]|nr:3-methyl-2-oxobutanoate hydroxymethyltransferase [Candidatus Omnitrophota bacterium]HOJ61423.1 3-methyl-2-oxobutanoate hydroxymethyltransferase [bacterium]HOL93235.1 3-methyl-2-oxobutanoate hydroxymethyltransferase [bacterium]HPP00926.1 3-methyl-2-oxobutanoate hydroxymethyltransferase [bacterium]